MADIAAALQAQVESLGNGPITSDRYYRREFFEAERKAIFRCGWLHVGREAEVLQPGDFVVRSVEICDTSILILRDRENRLRAFHNVCSHRGSILVEQSAGNASAFVCPYHRWTYGLDGLLRGVPGGATFFGLDKENCGLREVAVDTSAGFLFSNLDFDVQETLATFLGDVAPVLARQPFALATDFVEFEVEMAANWKTAADNFQETYHISSIHQASLVGRVTGPHNPLGQPLSYRFFGPHRQMLLWGNPEYRPGKVESIAYQFGGGVSGGTAKTAESASIAPEEMQSVNTISIFPNLFINVFGNTYNTHQFWPLDEGQTRSSLRMYFPKARNAGERANQEFSLSAVRDIIAEDVPTIESSHRGLMSGVVKNLHFHLQEGLCRHLYLSVENAVSRHQVLHSASGGAG
jgi:phenylpropionate dioxygenase-like ring-hydroxylating dioxygenase large terminal subunit